MKIINNIKELKEEIKILKRKNSSIGLVPTMGALHNGHKSLIERAVSENEDTIVSIFVNPIQFGVNEDLDKYPRTLDNDLELCKNAGVSIVFCPSIEEMYQGIDKNDLTLICPPYCVLDKLCAKSRNGHFDGVLSVVAKLFNLTHATKAYFGQKDAQQLFIVKKMVKDLNFDIEIIPCPIVREQDGLALSSRNKYLNQDERKIALNIFKSLEGAKKLVKMGINDPKKIVDNSLMLMKEMDVEYIEFVDIETFEIQSEINKNTLMLIAAKTPISKTRLIDNMMICE